MTDPSFLTQFLVILLVATVIAAIFERLRLPTVLGFLLAGVVIGPYGLKIITDPSRIHQLADLGIILLMFTIGLELSLDRWKGLKRLAILGGTFQILISIAVAILFALWRGWTPYQGFVLGAVIALSSTAVVLKFLMDRGELDTEFGKIAVAILIFQDLAVVPLMVLVTGLQGSSTDFVSVLGGTLLKAVLFLGAMIALSRFLLPTLVRQIATTRNREIFFLSAVILCLATAWAGGQLGLSLALGAFFAGFIFANTDFSYQLIADVAPLRHIFVSLFFVSIGMLFNVQFAFEHPFLVGSVVGLVLFVNFFIMTLMIMFFGVPPRIAMVVGIMLSQIGEFSFLIIETAKKAGGITFPQYQILLATAFLTLLLTPFLFALIPVILNLSKKISILGIPPSQWNKMHKSVYAIENHIILCGFGPSGQDLAQSFQEEKIPFVVLEMNPVKVRDAREKKMLAIYGDAANIEVMRRAGIESAHAVIVSFADEIGMSQIIGIVQQINPKAFLLVRTRFERDVPRLYELGADGVVMEEWEASYELNHMILKHFQVSPEHIKRHLDRIRNRKELAIEQAILNQSIQKPSSR